MMYLPQSCLMLILLVYNVSGKYDNFDSELLNAATVNNVLHFTYNMEKWLDTTQQPCDNFFDYVCGRSINNSQVQLDERHEQQQLKFEEFLNGTNINNEQLMDAELKLKYFYLSCQEGRSVDNLKSTLMYRSIGGWPASDDSTVMLRKRHNMNWLQVLSAFHEAGVSYFFKTKIELTSNRRVLHMQPDNSVRYSLRKFEQLASDIMQNYEIDAGKARLVALEVLHFERLSRDIMDVNMVNVTRFETNTQEFSYGDFKQFAFPSTLQLDWDGYFRKVLGKSLKDSDLIIVQGKTQLTKYFELLQNTTITRFLNWIWLDYLMDKTPQDCHRLAEIYFSRIYQHIIERSSVDKIHMARMYSDLSQMFDQLLFHTPWIDELTQQYSRLFSSRIIHLILNGDASLDKEYEQLAITSRNFYRNLEKIQRFLSQSHKMQAKRTPQQNQIIRASEEFMKIFLIVNSLLGSQQNLTTPLNYMMVGEHFSEMMIGGGSFQNPGSWRSMDSEQQFQQFDKCLSRQETLKRLRLPRKSKLLRTSKIVDNKNNLPLRNFHLNDLILKMLAQQLTWQSFQQWLHQERQLEQRLDALLNAGHLQLSLRKLYFILTVLVDCQRNPLAERRHFVHAYLRNFPAFSQTFQCQRQDQLNAFHRCKVL